MNSLFAANFLLELRTAANKYTTSQVSIGTISDSPSVTHYSNRNVVISLGESSVNNTDNTSLASERTIVHTDEPTSRLRFPFESRGAERVTSGAIVLVTTL